MHWSDEGIVTHIKRHGESRLIVSLLTRDHGRHLGLLRESAKAVSAFQPGVQMAIRWNARLAEHLGSWTGDLLYSPLGEILEQGLRLSALSSACALIEISLPERQIHRDIYQALHHFIYVINTPLWPDAYIHLEQVLLANAGITLDFSHCAATGITEELIYVSPRSGRAVSRQAGIPYQDRLLPLPSFLTRQESQPQERDPLEILQALEMTESFLNRFIFSVHQLQIPSARERLKSKLRRLASGEKSL